MTPKKNYFMANSFFSTSSFGIIKDIARISFAVLIDNLLQKGKSLDLRVVIYGNHQKPRKYVQENWLYNFIQEYSGKKIGVSWYKPNLILTSIFGDRVLLRKIIKKLSVPSILFSGENLHLQRWSLYDDYLLDLTDLSMGFDFREETNYLRFPLWLTYIFTPKEAAGASLENIQTRLKKIELSSFTERTKFAAMLARHDGLGNVSRSKIVKSMQQIDTVSCPGDICHNDSSLKKDFADNKKEYLKQFIYNICSENSSESGYVTEKLLEALEAGTIPVYWGDYFPEPNILNNKRIIFWQENSDNRENLAIIKKIYRDRTFREKFLQEPVFVPNAAKEIYKYFKLLKNSLDQVIK